MKHNGLLFTFEGIDGSGKSTQARFLNDHFIDSGFSSVLFREPGGTAIGEKIRALLLDASLNDMTPLTELFLYCAARAQITATVIKPALDHGSIVVMDRFYDSTTAYQGHARGLGDITVAELNDITTGHLVPDATFIIDCDPTIAQERYSGTRDRLEAEGIDFMRKVREGFLSLAQDDSRQFFIIDGNRDIESVRNDVLSCVMPLVSEIERRIV